jgi:ornithine decarboxylase
MNRFDLRAYDSPLDVVRAGLVDLPIVCARAERVRSASRWFQTHFPGDTLYAVKANPNPWVIKALQAAGARMVDVASLPEIQQVQALCPEAEMAFLHPVKSREAIRAAYFEFGVRTFALDCEAELEKIRTETENANDLKLVVRLAVSNQGALLSQSGKFGVGAAEAAGLIRTSRQYGQTLGVSFHVGSQCMQPLAYRRAMLDAARHVKRAGVEVDILDVGGGFPSNYPGMQPPPMSEYVAAIEDTFHEINELNGATLWCEPGRALVAEGASVLTRVELRKGDALYLNDGAYGSLFDAAHAGWRFPVRLLRPSAEPTQPFRFHGPTCDALDSMQGPFMLPACVREGDVIEVGMLGAYGTAMSTRFNGFGATQTVQVADTPWPSMYDASRTGQRKTVTAQSICAERA